MDSQTKHINLTIKSKINPDDAGEINPCFILLISNENNDEIFF